MEYIVPNDYKPSVSLQVSRPEVYLRNPNNSSFPAMYPVEYIPDTKENGTNNTSVSTTASTDGN